MAARLRKNSVYSNVMYRNYSKQFDWADFGSNYCNSSNRKVGMLPFVVTGITRHNRSQQHCGSGGGVGSVASPAGRRTLTIVVARAK